MQYIDSHCHITCDRLYGRVDDILKNCVDQQVTQLLVICCQREELTRAQALKAQHAGIHVAYGFYPCDTYALREQDYDDLEALCRCRALDVLGEIGLDYHYEDTDKVKQKEALIRQLHIAARYQLPVSIHLRDATLDGLTILKEHCQTPFVLHCFSGSAQTALEAVKLGGYISFAGPLTFHNARSLPEAAVAVPADRLLVETDSPYLTPVPHRGKENEPMYVRHTFDKLCELRQAEPEALSRQLLENYLRFLGNTAS